MISTDLGVRERRFVIVGGTRDMGYEAGRVLAGDGAQLALIGRSRERAERAAADLGAEQGTPVFGFEADASRADGIVDVIDAAVEQLGGLDGLLTTPGWVDQTGTLLEVGDDVFDDVHQTIFMSVVRSVRAALPHLIEAGEGTIVTTSAYSIHAPKPFLHAYSAQKHAVANLTKNIAKTYGPAGVRANCVCPGAVTSAVVRKIIGERAAEDGTSTDEAERTLLLDEWKMPVALQRLGRPHEIGEMMAFLLSPRSAYTTGAVINVDGGTDF